MQTRSDARCYSVADDPNPDVWRLRARLKSGEIDVYGAASRVAAVNIPSGHFREQERVDQFGEPGSRRSVKNGKTIICSLWVHSVIFRNSLTKRSIRCEASIIAPPT